MVECSFTICLVVGSNLIAATETSDIVPISSKDFVYIQATTESRFTLKCICDMIITYSQIQSPISTHNTTQSLGQFS